MKRAIWLCGLVAFAAAGCKDPDDSGPAGPGRVDIEKTLVELVRVEGIPANGSDSAIIRVTARDRDGRTIPNRTVAARSSNPTDTVSTELEEVRTDEDGVAEVHVWATTVGTRVISLEVQGITMPQRPTVTFVPGDGSYLEFVEAPTIGKAGRPLRPAVRVEVKDAKGNRVTTYDEEISLHVGDTVTLKEKAVQGIATFTNVVINQPGPHILLATGPGLQEASSGEIEIIVGDPASLSFKTQPRNVEVGEPFTVSVEVLDPAGNVVVGSNETIRLRLYSNPTGAELEGEVVAQAEEGVATFKDLRIHKASAGYQLTAAASGYQSAISDAFVVGGAAPNREASTLVIRPNGDDDEPRAIANGMERLRIEGRLVDIHGNPIAGQPITLSASGEGHRFHPSEEGKGHTLEMTTTGAGTFAAWISSTKAEVKTVTLRAGEYFELTATAIFVPDAVDPDRSELVPEAVTAVVDIDPPVDGENGGIRFEAIAYDPQGNPIRGLPVSLSASGSENRFETSDGTEIALVTTDDYGVATFWFKSSKAEKKTVTVRMGSATLSREVVFIPDVPDRDASEVVGETNEQLTTVGTATREPFRVVVRDRYGNPIEDVVVTFAVVEGGGSLSRENSEPTDEFGETSTTLTVGTVRGINTVSWHGGWEGDAREDLVALGAPGAATSLEVITDVTNLSANAGMAPGIELEFVARDAFGNPTSTVLNFSGDGTFPSQSSIPAWNPVSNIDPSLTINWVLKPEAGPNTLVATLSDGSSPVQIEAEGKPGAPDSMVIDGADSFELDVLGGPQLLRVQLFDANGNPVQPSEDLDVTVRFAIDLADGYDAGLHGHLTAAGQTGQVVDLPVGPDGYVEAEYKAGTRSGTRTVTASVVDTSIAQAFTFTIHPDDADELEIFGGDEQEGTVGEELDELLVVRAIDQYGNPVSGVDVTFALTQEPTDADGAGLGEKDVKATDPIATNEQGLASVALILGNRPGAYEVTASAAGLGAVTFSIDALAGEPASIEVDAGDDQVGIVAQLLTDPLVVIVQDVFGNAVEGAKVTFSGPVDFSVDPAEVDTISDGKAEIRVTKLPELVGAYQVVATVSGGDEDYTATFNLFAEAGPAKSIEVVSGNKQKGFAGLELPEPLVVRALDQFGNPTSDTLNQKVLFSTTAGELYDPEDGTWKAAVALAPDENGEVFARWRLPDPALPPLMTNAFLSGAGAEVFVAQVIDPPTALEMVAGDRQRINTETDFSNPVVVRALDAANNPVENVLVSFAVTNGTVVSSDEATGPGGYATAYVQAGSLEDEVVVVASLDDFAGVGGVTFVLYAEDVAVCHAAGSVVYFLDEDSELQSHLWAAGPGTYLAAEDEDSAVYVEFSEVVSAEPAFGLVHRKIHLDCDGTTVEIAADATGATLTIDDNLVDWDAGPTGDVDHGFDPATGAFSVSCNGGVGVEAYDDGLDHFTRVTINGEAGASLCADPPQATEMNAP